MELFIALFGGGFLLCKLIWEMAAHADFERRYAEERSAKESDYEKWERAVIDEGLEERCKNAAPKLLYCGGDGADEDLRSVFDALPLELKRLIGGLILLDKARFLTIALMASFGKLPYRVASSGEKIMPRAIYDKSGMGKEEFEADWWSQHDFFILVDKILQKNLSPHVYGPLMCDYHPHSDDPNIKMAYSDVAPKVEEYDPKELRYATSLVYYWYPGRCGKIFV